MAVITVSNTGGNWSSSTTWVGGVVPISGDSVNFTSTSGNLTVNVSTANLVGIDFTNYTGTCTFTNSINTSGTINLGSGGYTQAGANGLTIVGNTTIITNGVVWSRTFSLNSGTITLTLNDNFNLSGSFTASGLSGALTLSFGGIGQFLPTGPFITNNAGATGIATITITLPNDISVASFTYNDNSGAANRRNLTLNGNKNITVNGGVYFGNTRTSTLSGTCTIIFAGNGNFTMGTAGGVSVGIYSIPIKIDNTLNTCNFVGVPLFTNTTVTYTSGTITGVTCYFSTCTLNLNAGGQWGTDVVIRGSTTLTSDATFGNLTTQTTAVVFSGAFTVNVKGNLSINIVTSGLSTPIFINGSGSQSWTHGSAVYLSNNLTINKPSGTLTLGANVFYNTGTLTHTLGDVDTTTNSNTFFSQSATINTPNIIWNNFFYAPNASQTLTLSNNLYVSNTFTCGGNGTISGVYDIYCTDCNINNSSSGTASVTITQSGIIYCSNNLTYSLATTCRNTGTVYVGGSVFFNAPSLNQGALNIYMVGNGTISSSSLSNAINSNLYFDTPGKITITTPLSFSLGTSKTINLIRGNVDASNCDLYFNQSFNHTLINMHKIVWRGIYLGNGATLTMNEFFSGKPNLKTIVASSAGTNYTITFTDNFEKIAKFVNISGCTLARPQQLLLITDSKKSSTNTRGIRYINNLPNGISKNNPPTSTQTTYTTNMLVGDPSMISNI